MSMLRCYLKDSCERKKTFFVGPEGRSIYLSVESDSQGRYVVLRGPFLSIRIPDEIKDKVEKVSLIEGTIDAPLRKPGVYVHKTAVATVECDRTPGRPTWAIIPLEAEKLEDAKELYMALREGTIKPATSWNKEQMALGSGVTVLAGSTEEKPPLLNDVLLKMHGVDVAYLEYEVFCPYVGCDFMDYAMNRMIILSVNEFTNLGNFMTGFPYLACWTRMNGQNLVVLVDTNGKKFRGQIFNHKTDSELAGSFRMMMSGFEEQFSHVSFFTDAQEAISHIGSVLNPELEEVIAS